MNIARKIRLTLTARTSKALDLMADPRESPDYSYRRQVELLAKLQRDAAEAAAARTRVETQMRALRREQAELRADGELSSLVARHESLRSEEERLAAACARLEGRVEAFRVRKEVTEAASAAAEAQSRLGDVSSCLSAETGNAGTAAMSRERRRQLLTQLRSGIADVTACCGRLDRQIDTLRRLRAETREQARKALEVGRDDLAREATVRWAGIDRQLSDLVTQRDSWQAQVERFTAAYEQLAGEGGLLCRGVRTRTMVKV